MKGFNIDKVNKYTHCGNMKKEIVHSLTSNFEDHASQTDSGVEFWLARDLQHLLGYSEWRNFQLVVNNKGKQHVKSQSSESMIILLASTK